MAIEYQHGFVIKRFSKPCDYQTIYQQMQALTALRKSHKAMFCDEIWLLEHQPVYTLGLAGKKEHILNPKNIPVQQSDRGGQVTYHGIGQLMVYLLFDLHRWGDGVKQLVFILEQVVIDVLATYDIEAHRRKNAAGVYVNEEKIAALGLRIRYGCSYHGLSFNLSMDLSPFLGINPCGYADLKVTQLSQLGVEVDKAVIEQQVLTTLIQYLSVN